MSERVITYIDGLNLYQGMRKKGWKWAYWLDVYKLSNQLLKPGQILVSVKYFSTRMVNSDGKGERQNTYLDALSTLKGVTSYFGIFLNEPQECPLCKEYFSSPKEKMTDVNIASHIFIDAYRNQYDTALIVSGDSDFCPAIAAIRNNFGKRAIVAFPPKRRSDELKSCANGYINISDTELSNSLFPDIIKKPDGFVLTKPENWV